MRANVLFSYPLTSVLLELAEARLYRPIWSQDIHEEWIRAVTRTRPDIAPEKLERRRAAMELKLNRPQCGQGSIQLIPEHQDHTSLEVLQGCRVKSKGAIDFSPTGYYSLDVYQAHRRRLRPTPRRKARSSGGQGRSRTTDTPIFSPFPA